MEFLTFLLDILHEELVGGDAETEKDAMAEVEKEAEHSWKKVEKEREVVDDKSRQEAARANAATSICRIFHARIRSEVKFTSKKMNSVTFQRLHCLSLEISHTHTAAGHGGSPAVVNGPNGGKQQPNPNPNPNLTLTGGKQPREPRDAVCDLDAALRAYFGEERLSGHEKDRKRVSLDTFPPALLLQLKRFSFDQQRGAVKITREVNFGTRLRVHRDLCSTDLFERALDTLTKGMPSPGHGRAGSLEKANKDPAAAAAAAANEAAATPAESVQEYALTAVILHHGESTHGGHYTAFCLDFDGVTWRHFDDSKIAEVSEAEVLSQRRGAYLLFFKRV